MTTPNPPTFQWLDENAEPYCPGKEACTLVCDENCPVYANNSGYKLFEEGKIEEAKELFKKAIDRTPDYRNSSAWINFATVCNKQGHAKASFEAFKNAYCINPNIDKVYAGLSASYACLEEYDKALEWCDKYAEKFGEEGIAKLKAKIMKKMND